MNKSLAAAGALCAMLAVILGAFGAHALENRLPAELLETYHTAVQYHFYHALGLLLIGALAPTPAKTALLEWSGYAMLAGIVLFPGSLYALVFTGIKAFGAITPFGGICFIAAWLLLAIAMLKKR